MKASQRQYSVSSAPLNSPSCSSRHLRYFEQALRLPCFNMHSSKALLCIWYHAYDEGLVNVGNATITSLNLNTVTPRLKEHPTQRLTVSEAYGYLPPSILLTEVTVPYWLQGFLPHTSLPGLVLIRNWLQPNPPNPPPMFYYNSNTNTSVPKPSKSLNKLTEACLLRVR